MSYRFFLLLGGLALISCKKDRLTDEKSVLIGSWNWSYTNYEYSKCEQGGGYQTTYDYSTTGKTFRMEFFQKGKVKFYENEELVSGNRIVFDDFYKFPGTDDIIFDIYLDNKEENRLLGRIFESNPDCLYTWDFPYQTINSPCDEYQNYFIRE